MKANIVYSDLNPCGGAERLTLVTMQAIIEMGIDMNLTTLQKPDITRLENAYGKGITSVIKNIKKVNILRAWEEQSVSDSILGKDYDLTINTHGDIAPYYHKSLSKNNAITYCHFPSAKSFIEFEDKAYLEKHIVARATSSFPNSVSSTITTSDKHQYTNNPQSSNIINFNREMHLKWLKEAYENLMKNSTLLTNSKYSRKAIFEIYGIEDAVVLSPPVDVDTFRNAVFLSSSSFSLEDREDVILVVCRIDPLKKIDNAIKLAKLLKDNNIGSGMKIVGSFEPYYYDYYLYLKKMIVDFSLSDYITFEINVSLDKLLSFMGKSKIYFHPRQAEHFGISIVQAMSAGLVPIVPAIGGQTEFVPSKYHFHTLEQAAQIVSFAFNIPYSERVLISDSVTRFSASNYIKRFKQVISDLLLNK